MQRFFLLSFILTFFCLSSYANESEEQTMTGTWFSGSGKTLTIGKRYDCETLIGCWRHIEYHNAMFYHAGDYPAPDENVIKNVWAEQYQGDVIFHPEENTLWYFELYTRTPPSPPVLEDLQGYFKQNFELTKPSGEVLTFRLVNPQDVDVPFLQDMLAYQLTSNQNSCPYPNFEQLYNWHFNILENSGNNKVQLTYKEKYYTNSKILNLIYDKTEKTLEVLDAHNEYDLAIRCLEAGSIYHVK